MYIEENKIVFKDDDRLYNQWVRNLYYDGVKLMSYSTPKTVDSWDKFMEKSEEILLYWLHTRNSQGRLEGIIEDLKSS